MLKKISICNKIGDTMNETTLSEIPQNIQKLSCDEQNTVKGWCKKRLRGKKDVPFQVKKK